MDAMGVCTAEYVHDIQRATICSATARLVERRARKRVRAMTLGLEARLEGQEQGGREANEGEDFLLKGERTFLHVLREGRGKNTEE